MTTNNYSKPLPGLPKKQYFSPFTTNAFKPLHSSFDNLNLLPQVIFWPDNILDLFKKFNVKKKFDFLSGVLDLFWICFGFVWICFGFVLDLFKKLNVKNKFDFLSGVHT